MEASRIVRDTPAVDAERLRVLEWLLLHGPAPLDAMPRTRPLTAAHTRAIARHLLRDGLVARVSRPWTGEAPRITITRLGRLVLHGSLR